MSKSNPVKTSSSPSRQSSGRLLNRDSCRIHLSH